MTYAFIDTVLIVDGASTAAYLAPAFRAYGIRCVHVISSPDLPELYRNQFVATDYVRTIHHDGDLEHTLAQLRDLRIGAVLHGLDAALELADTLAERLDVAHRNPLASSAARRDKVLMNERVTRAGLRAPSQYSSRSADDVVGWVRALGQLPVVVKPSRSAGVTGVKICRSLGQVEAAARDVLATQSIYGQPNEDVIVQTYSEGQEYIVDSVSVDGRHKVVSLWEVHRDRSHAPRLDKMLVVDHTAPRFAALLGYARQVLDALDVRHGPTHLEIIDTAAGPTLVELNARLHGSLDPRLTTAVNGENHVSATVATVLNPERFADALNQRPVFNGFCGHVLLLSSRVGRLNKPFAWEAIEALPSFVGHKRWVKPGDTLSVTTDLKTALGTVGLYNATFEALLADCHRIRDIEARFFSDAEAVIQS
ncbi:ATP-grasp domain-containing protein [Paraburkholderia sp. D15]|uniref:ATP-grasp domain-containing protein n=1 Tax=Paraburkholderia sp. D15 TaxID=2880218 RepID=UPI002479DDA7|nr:ATP-grasp domain-containing protein [Paraburkholderia sp. D15]WGS53245.1 ATP-grasp domain-containing protein [Paraburkholderia sp. D15]